MRRFARTALLAATALCGLSHHASAETCTADSYGTAVDAAAADIRAFNADAQPKLQEKLKALKNKKGWIDESFEEKGLDYLRDTRIAELDQQSNELFTKIDTLGRPEPGQPVDCAGLAELKAAGSEMLAVLKTKSAYLSEKIDREIGQSTAPEQPRTAAVTPSAPSPTAKPATKSVETPSKDERPKSAPPKSWETTTAHVPPPAEDAPPPGVPYVPPEPLGPEEGYTIDEIYAASRGVFGTVSTGLASVIEHAFAELGRPTAYVLGNEGGGALLAGLRYGEGTLYLRSGGTRHVYWHGPSVGYDVGGEGSRTLFLIYRLNDDQHLYRMFTGIDGTAYLVGGVGMTLLKGGDVIMAPIRSGLGLRLGASVGYVRFTSHETWNPF